MPSIQDRLTHAKNLAEWKVNQQRRILDIQVKISDFEKQIHRSKQLLSDTVYSLYKEKKIQEKELTKVCKDIDTIYLAIEKSKAELEAARNEESPAFVESTPTVYSGLVCPECGMKLTGKFCPTHGVEGVPASSPTPDTAPSKSGLVCPQCGKPVADKFCVQCGVEGVKQEPKPAPAQEEKPAAPAKAVKTAKTAKASPQPKKESKTVEETVLVCPECGKELDKGMKFCNEHGKKGVLKSKTAAAKKNPTKPAPAKKSTKAK